MSACSVLKKGFEIECSVSFPFSLKYLNKMMNVFLSPVSMSKLKMNLLKIPSEVKNLDGNDYEERILIKKLVQRTDMRVAETQESLVIIIVQLMFIYVGMWRYRGQGAHSELLPQEAPGREAVIRGRS